MTNQEFIQENDIVEVFDDYRAFLNGRQGKVFTVIGNRIYVEFENVPPQWRRAIVPRQNVRKVEKT